MGRQADGATTTVDGRDTRWADHREERHARILETAIAQIDRDGPGAGVAAIAAEAGVPRSVVYKLFDDRRDLDAQIRRRIVDSVTAELLPFLAARGTVRDTVHSAASTYVGWVAAHPNLHRYLGASEALPGPSRVARTGKAEFARGVETAIERFLPRLFPGATVPPGLPAHLAFGLVGLSDSVVNQWLLAGARTPADEVTAFVSAAACAVIEAAATLMGAELDLDAALTREA